jgi:hypothetical protein
MMATIHRLDTHRIVHLPLKTPDQIVREHGVEAQVRDKPDFRETRHVVIREPLFDRIINWLGDTFGESPRGFAFFCGLLFPLCAAAFCIGYFGLRELLAVIL